MSDNQPDIKSSESSDPNYWRIFEELYRDKEFIEASHKEFDERTKDNFNPGDLNNFSRRKFLALLGASAALAGAGCNYRDNGEIIPYNKKPEEILPGTPNFYASTCTACGGGCGILIKTREGRPIKIDGNPDHPVSQGKICAKGQASILNLYDPERLKSPLKRSRGGTVDNISWQDADYAVMNHLDKAGGKEIALITNKINSPTGMNVLSDFVKRFPSTRIYAYEYFNENNRRAAWNSTNGNGEFPLIKWDEAKVILSLESDFLGMGDNKVETIRLFSKGRDIKNINDFNRLYVVEGNMSLTGMNADYRIRLNPLFLGEFIELLGSQLAGMNRKSIEDFTSKHKIDSEKIVKLINDLNRNRGRSIIHGGDSLPQEMLAAINRLNDSLGNSALYRTDTRRVSYLPVNDFSGFDTLISRMNNDSIAAIIHYDTNPVYHFPTDSGYKEALKKVSMVVTLALLENETSAESDYTFPLSHNFESWGDVQTRTGFYSLQQPVISPLFNSRQKEAVILNWITGKTDGYSDTLYYDYLVNNWRNNLFSTSGLSGNFDQFWMNALHDGVILSKNEAAVPNLANQNAIAPVTKSNTEKKKYSVVIKESYTLGDGRFANNGWLQELPHPVSKVTWDNYAAVSYLTAKNLDLLTNDLIEIELNGRKLEVPVLVQPGAADNTITIENGYGRYSTGVVATGVGFNINNLTSKNGGFSQWIYTTNNIRKTGGTYKLASTQEHHIFDDELTKDQIKKRNIVREGTLDQYRKDRNFLKEDKGLDQPSVYGTHLPEMYSGVKWGMAIDMNRCLGCGECVIACNVENNVPVVGKDQVLVSREMQWLRIDRYYSGSPEDPQVLSQVMLCQHCDHAPCENVCPVVATTHSIDGLNQMAYNRCVGTRYCSNNCPYKVRRFNFFNFRDHFRDGYQESNVFTLVFNPEVTVRSRGVMEKCTFCIQRIMKAREDAIRDNRQLKGTDVTTACQDACISNAITFGDMNDKSSEYSKMRDHELGYYVLEELNTRPNITYIAKLRNTDQEEVS
jgi:MoCo/4Fe-4S cofactor protein with predicted Tat translocation signal